MAIAPMSQVNRQLKLFSSYAINGICNASKVDGRKRFKLSSSCIGSDYLGFDDNSTFLPCSLRVYIASALHHQARLISQVNNLDWLNVKSW